MKTKVFTWSLNNLAELKINLEEGNGLFYAHAEEFIGCCGRAPTKDAAIDALLQDVKKYSEWLLSKDFTNEYMIKAKDFLAGINEMQIVEEITNVAQQDVLTGKSALFKSDHKVISEEDFEFYLEVIKSLPEELMRIVFQYSNEQREQEVLEGKPTINQALTKIYTTQFSYISRFGEEIEKKFLEVINLTRDELESLSLYERIFKVQLGAIALLRSYYSNHADDKFTSENLPEYPKEHWTIKKIIRRFIEHERECINGIRLLVEELEGKVATEKTN
ncbi:MAG: hypothetical protein ACTSQK_00715 [Candidatus Heimdallarchaeota archaeon]